MRVLSYAALAVCIASPAFAKTVTLTPASSIGFNGSVDESDLDNPNCMAVHDGPFLVTGALEIGSMAVEYTIDDRRANVEFDIQGLKSIKKATLKLHGEAVDAMEDSAGCIMSYNGDGVGTAGDYMPLDKSLFALFPLDGGLEREVVEADYAIDITSLLKTFMDGGRDFLGIQIAADEFVDTAIMLSGIRIDLTIPEPATLALFGLGLLGISARRRKRL